MTAEGDLGRQGSYAVGKKVRWQTDSYGYRSSPADDEVYEIVLVGDSFAVGSSLDHEDTLAGQLGNLLKRDVYAFAPEARFSVPLRSARFQNPRTSCFVLVLSERSLEGLPLAEGTLESLASSPATSFSGLVILIDRLAKASLLRAGRNNIRRWFSRIAEMAVGVEPSIPMHPSAIVGANGVLFRDPRLEDDQAYGKPEAADRLIEVLHSYRTAAEALGKHFVFMPIPEKETVYWQRTGGLRDPEIYLSFVKRTEMSGIATVDLLTPYLEFEARDDRIDLYHADDSHWTALGVSVAAELLGPACTTQARSSHEPSAAKLN
ncbi:MAG: hypothetical protein K0U98_03425 [Deltaproteobacteria bacterium]|nr:hypothetical protein [Deltaproteobacteria bacterium]